MPTYTQRLTFTREVTIEAKNAHEANTELRDIERTIEIEGNLLSDGAYDFVDEPVECPACKGNGYEYESDEDQCGHECRRCGGEGTIPFESK